MKTTLLFLFAAALLTVSGCSETGSGNGDIKTAPLHMSVRTDNDVNLHATGLPLYPGASYVKDEDGDKGADVNLGFAGFGLKVVALNFKSSDAPDKVAAFYGKEIRQFGPVLVCNLSDGRIKSPEEPGSYSGDLSCSSHSTGGKQRGPEIDLGGKGTLQLKTGSTHSQHIVSIQPDGSGSKFALVYVETHGRTDQTS